METLTELFATVTEWIDSLAALVTDSPLTYVIIFALTALDAILPVIPAEGTITAAAVLAGTGQLNIVWVTVAAALGAFVGDNIAYWIGRVAGRPLIERIMRGNMGVLDDVQGQFDRRGGIFIIVGRFVPGGRTAVSVGSGVLHYSWPRFLAFDAIAVVIWALMAAIPGYIGGVAFAERPWLALVIGFALSLAVGGTVALVQRWWERRNHGADPEAASDEESDSDTEVDGGPGSAVVGVAGTDGAAGDGLVASVAAAQDQDQADPEPREG